MKLPFALRLLALPAVAILASAGEAPAQGAERGWSVGVAAGLAGHALRPEGAAPIGGHAAASISTPLTSRLKVRVEGMITNFGEWTSGNQAPCRPDIPPTECGAPSAAVRLRAVTVGLGGGGRGERRYAVIGGGAYHLAAHPSAKGDTRAGLYGAYGRPLTKASPRITFEGQLHWVPGLSRGGEWSLPLRLGLTF